MSKTRSRGASIEVSAETGPTRRVYLSPAEGPHGADADKTSSLRPILGLRLAFAGGRRRIECWRKRTIEAQAQAPKTELPDGSRFRRHSIFEDATAEALPLTRRRQSGDPDWLEEARAEISERGQYLIFSDRGERQTVRIEDGWVRIGRSGAADIRLDDASVSRRHALIVNSEERGLRVLDDRSMNGVYLNGERVEWGALSDGDELGIGRYRLFVVDASGAIAAA
jgi:hypothetical protein